MPGVSISVFTAMIRACEKAHGPKMCADRIEEFRRLLAEAEEIYIGLPDFHSQEALKSKNKK